MWVVQLDRIIEYRKSRYLLLSSAPVGPECEEWEIPGRNAMTILRRNLFLLWMLCSLLWLAFVVEVFEHESRPDNEISVAAIFLLPPILLFLAGLGLARIWKRDKPTMMDGVIKLAYGNSPPRKTANLEVAVELSYEALLVRIVDIAEVQKIATQLYNGKMPYSTHDLAAATALNVFRNADRARREQLGQIQIFSRLAVIDWVKEKKVNPLLAQAFEDTLYKMFKAYETGPTPTQIAEGERPTMADARSAPTVKSLLMARDPPWDRVAPIVIDTILEAITDKGLLEAFVMHSMNAGLLVRYEALGREDDDPTFIRAAISHILCQTGNTAMVSLQKAVEANQKDTWLNACTVARDTFEAAIALAKNQIAGYIGMARLYGLVGKTAQSHDWAKRGLLELEEMRRSQTAKALRDSTIFPPDMLDQVELQLRSYLEL